MDDHRLRKNEERLVELNREIKSLIAEKAGLKGIRFHHPKEPLGTVVRKNEPVSSDEKVALFLLLFRCRETVYPVQWQNTKKGIKGYSPACHNEWIRGICKKPKVKCTECDHQDFAKLDEEVVTNHLLGKITIGSYAIRENDISV